MQPELPLGLEPLPLHQLQNEEIDEWLTVSRCARDFLGVYQATLYRWIKVGYGPPVYFLYGKKRYKKSEVLAWIESRRQITEDPMMRVLSVVAASKVIGIHENTLWRWIERGTGPPTFIFNGRYVFKEIDVKKWVQERDENAERTVADTQRAVAASERERAGISALAAGSAGSTE